MGCVKLYSAPMKCDTKKHDYPNIIMSWGEENGIPIAPNLKQRFLWNF
jgi:hypothetical protein